MVARGWANVKLKFDPFQVFQGDRSPVGLRARIDFDGRHGCAYTAEKLAGEILVRQRPDGSWGDTSSTIKALYDLSLLNPGGNLITRQGVRWLLEEHLPPMVCTSTDGAPYDGLFFRTEKNQSTKLNAMTGTPFTRGCSGFIKTGAALYLAAEHGLKKSERIAPAIESLEKVVALRGGRWCSWSCSNNILQGFAALPEAREGSAMRKAVATLGKIQKPSGAWAGAPFYPTLFALSRLDSKPAKKQVAMALAKCARTQRRDGAWGGRGRLHDTYLVLESMRRAGAL